MGFTHFILEKFVSEKLNKYEKVRDKKIEKRDILNNEIKQIDKMIRIITEENKK